MSSTSFIFDDEDEEMTTVPSGRLRCGRCVWETSVTVQCCYIYVLAVAVAGVLVAFGVQMPHQVALGAFGSLKQVDLPGAVADAYFQSVHLEAIDLQSGGPYAGHAGSFESFEWHSLELIWQMGPSQSEREKDFQPSVVSDTYMSEVRLAEVALRELPGWVSLCNACPAEVRFLCTAGDSLVALSFGSWQEPSPANQVMGLEWEVSFNAEGIGAQLPVETLLAFAQEVRPQLLERWLPRDPATRREAAGPESRQLLRSTFLFYLPPADVPRFHSFVEETLRPRLRKMQDESLGEEGGLRAFYKIDGRAYDDLDRSFQHLPLLVLAAVNVLVTVLLFTRRVLLAVAAALLSTASVLVAASQITPGTVVAWQLLAVNAAELAIACSSILSYNANRVLPKLQELKHLISRTSEERRAGLLWLGHWLQMPLQLFVPPLATTLLLLALDMMVAKLPMAQELTSAALLGSLTVLCLGPWLFVPAVLLGDWMAEGREESNWCAPQELSGRPLSKEQRRQRRRAWLLAVVSAWPQFEIVSGTPNSELGRTALDPETRA
ncbi:unnamed protein product [Effrenium voratum]|uniref:Uncharacterized protein n=1 Tax=Effrenium voratum TaxID=2562239 RepID=A0AA36I946_9DINO|nr:unnamed protein product [Effrenium voratum]